MWLDVIEGRRHPLKYGYYCTRQPDEAERMDRITRDEARRAEDQLFTQTLPWSTSTHRHRFGTKHLIDNISALLTKVIDERWVMYSASSLKANQLRICRFLTFQHTQIRNRTRRSLCRMRSEVSSIATDHKGPTRLYIECNHNVLLGGTLPCSRYFP